MAQLPSTSSASSTNFESIFSAALKVYNKQTKKDIASHPLATELQSCDSSSAIIAILRTQIQTFDQSQGADEKWTKWLGPTVNVLFAFSATLGNGVGVVFPPANAIFTGIGVLLQAIKDVRASKEALIDLFGRMEFFFKRLEAYIKVRPTAAMRDIIIKIMVEVISILGIVTKEIQQGRTKRYLKKLFGRKDVEDALQRLDKLTHEEARMAAAEALTITRGIDDRVNVVNERLEGVDVKVEGIQDQIQIAAEDIQDQVQTVDSKVEGVDGRVRGVDRKVSLVIEGMKETGVTIQQVVNQVTDIKRNKLRKNLRKWIAPPDPTVNYNVAFGVHHEGTAAWCIDGNTFADWKASGSFLWIHGKPGSGKSILSSVIIRDLKSISNAGSAFLAYFYFDFKDTAKQDSRALLSSLLVQLSDQSDILCDTLFSLYFAHKQGSEQATDDSLAQCLNDMLTMTGQVPIYLIMDALDECPNDSGIPSSRQKVLKLVKDLVGLHRPNLRLCVTSRPEFDIRTALKPLATQQVSLHDESGQKQDINDYITSVVCSDERMKRWRDNDKTMVIGGLTAKADGMFRWVFCQLEVLRLCFPANLRHTIEELPKSLDETYKRILNEINNANRVHAYRLLQCLAVALRPLRVEELAEVLAFDLTVGGIPKLNADWRWEDQEEAVLSACSSLVSVIINNSSRVVQFSHFSVKEFLTSDRLAGCLEEVSQFHIPVEPSHAILAQACLGVLLCLDDHTDEDSTKNIPLYRYAAEYWVQHTQVGDVELQMRDTLDYFFDTDNPHFSALARIEHPGELLRVSGDEEPTGVPRSAAPLYFAAWKGLRGLVERLLTKHPHQVSQLGGLYGTPLHASVRDGHIEICQLLFSCGADINSRCGDNWTPLHVALGFDHIELGKWLLNHGADVNSREKRGLTPLYAAASLGKLEACRILLEHDAEVDSQNNDGWTPFLISSQHGYREVARLLLDNNADVRVRNTSGNTPLHFASLRGHLEVCRILLERKAEVDSRNSDGLTPFLISLETGHPDVTRLLLDHNVDVRVRSSKGNTPLHLAASDGHLEVCRILLERNAEVDPRNNDGHTPFLEAMEYGHTDVALLLLDHNADVRVRGTDGNTPLHFAAYYGNLEVCRILLERNAEVDYRNNDGHTPFLEAMEYGHTDVALLLLDHNADMRVHGADGNTSLHNAAYSGHFEVCRMLLEHNAEVDSRNDCGYTPFLRALQCGHLDVARLLLDHNADLRVLDTNGNTSLHIAAYFGHLEVCRMLLEYNADVRVCDDKGNTPLHFAAENGHLEVAQILLERNADVNSQNNHGSTPLSFASAFGHPVVVQLLLDHNADLYLRDADGGTPLHCAAIGGQLEVARILLELNVEVDSQNEDGWTPLHLAAKEGSAGVVQFLLDHGADVQARDLSGKTASEVARGPEQKEIVRLLSQCGAAE